MRVRRSILNIATHVLFMVVTMVVALPAAPWLIHWLGTSVYGGVRVVNDAFGYLTLLEMGLGGAIGPLLARAIGMGDDRVVRETLVAGARAYFWVAVGTLAVGLALTPVVPWFANGLNPAEAADLRRGWLVQLVAFLPLMLVPMRSVFDARQLGYVINLLMVGQSLVITGVSLVLARAGWGITGQALAQVVGIWSFSLAVALGAFRSYPGLARDLLTMPTTLETRRALRSLSAPTLLLNVSGRVGLLSDNLVIGALRNTGMVTSLVNTQKLAVMGQAFLSAVSSASWAALAELYAQGKVETFNRRVVEITRLVTVLGVVGLVPVVGYNHAFFTLWLARNKVEYGGDEVVALAAVNALIFGTQALWCWCFAATGKIRVVVPMSVALSVVNLAASVAMTRRVGISGPLIGTTVAFVVIGLWAEPWLLRRTFGTPPGPLLRAFGVPLAAGSAAAWALRAFTRSVHEPTTWAGLAAEMSLVALVMLALSVTLLLTREDRALWRVRFDGLRPRRTAASAAAVPETEVGMTP